jgi:hypothetical protein
MDAEEPDRQDTCLILNARNQPAVVSLDVENDAARLENARLRVRRLDVLRVAPLGSTNNVELSLVLRAGRFDPLMAGVIGRSPLSCHRNRDRS